jgi:hypothetical protein
MRGACEWRPTPAHTCGCAAVSAPARTSAAASAPLSALATRSASSQAPCCRYMATAAFQSLASQKWRSASRHAPSACSACRGGRCGWRATRKKTGCTRDERTCMPCTRPCAHQTRAHLRHRQVNLRQLLAALLLHKAQQRHPHAVGLVHGHGRVHLACGHVGLFCIRKLAGGLAGGRALGVELLQLLRRQVAARHAVCGLPVAWRWARVGVSGAAVQGMHVSAPDAQRELRASGQARAPARIHMSTASMVAPAARWYRSACSLCAHDHPRTHPTVQPCDMTQARKPCSAPQELPVALQPAPPRSPADRPHLLPASS